MYAVLDQEPEIRGRGGGRPSIPQIVFGPSGLSLV